RQVVKRFETAAGVFTALKGVNLRVNPGEFVAVVGKSGSGKSTLINMISGIDRPSEGQVFIGGEPVHTYTEGQLALWRGRQLGIIFQFFQLLPTLSLLENVMLPMDFAGRYAARERPRRALQLLDQVGVAQHAGKLPAAVSGGEQQRAAIARALANDPPILVADEPTGNLDSKTAQSVFALFESLVAGGKTILMVTHDPDLARRVERTVMLADGEIIETYLTQVFPTLTDRQLVEVTRGVQPRVFAPGADIVHEGEHPEAFFIVTKGSVEVMVTASDGTVVRAATITHGQYFGEIELLRGGALLAGARAGEDGVEMIALERETFARLLGGAPSIRQAIEEMAQARVQENIAARRREGVA
ncbi:MAG TPA: ATP-binding cassette domain-containing protein, partial [bacterium]|nr:ATP-binding cassette domain-containing protein [bacterium]